jgi:hypothetical protein
VKSQALLEHWNIRMAWIRVVNSVCITQKSKHSVYNSEKNDRGEFRHKQYIIVVVEDLLYRNPTNICPKHLRKKSERSRCFQKHHYQQHPRDNS